MPPRARPGAVPVALLVALALVALAVVAVRDLAVSQGWANGTEWSRSLVESADRTSASTGLVVGAVALGVLGLLLLLLALKPARRTHLRAASTADLWFSPRAVASMAQAVADRAPGVISAEATRATRRRIVVEVVTNQDSETVTARIRADVDEQVSSLTAATVAVRTTEVSR